MCIRDRFSPKAYVNGGIMSENNITGLKALMHGADYNPEQWLDMHEILERDIELMKKAGINCVSVGIFSVSYTHLGMV